MAEHTATWAKNITAHNRIFWWRENKNCLDSAFNFVIFALLELDWTFINFWDLLGIRVWPSWCLRNHNKNSDTLWFPARTHEQEHLISCAIEVPFSHPLGVNMKPYVHQLKIRHSCSHPMTYFCGALQHFIDETHWKGLPNWRGI